MAARDGLGTDDTALVVANPVPEDRAARPGAARPGAAGRAGRGRGGGHPRQGRHALPAGPLPPRHRGSRRSRVNTTIILRNAALAAESRWPAVDSGPMTARDATVTPTGPRRRRRHDRRHRRCRRPAGARLRHGRSCADPPGWRRRQRRRLAGRRRRPRGLRRGRRRRPVRARGPEACSRRPASTPASGSPPRPRPAPASSWSATTASGRCCRTPGRTRCWPRPTCRPSWSRRPRTCTSRATR